MTFLQLNVIKMFTVQLKLFFTLLSAIFFKRPITRTPDNSNLFSISLEGSNYRKSTVVYYRRAFDMVDHELLLRKLNVYGVANQKLN